MTASIFLRPQILILYPHDLIHSAQCGLSQIQPDQDPVPFFKASRLRLYEQTVCADIFRSDLYGLSQRDPFSRDLDPCHFSGCLDVITRPLSVLSDPPAVKIDLKLICNDRLIHISVIFEQPVRAKDQHTDLPAAGTAQSARTDPVNDNLQQITYASENVTTDTGEVLTSIKLLQDTMDQFQI